MKMLSPDEFRRSVFARQNMPNTPAIPRAVTEAEYRAILLNMLVFIHALGNDNDPAYSYTAFELEEMVIAAGLTLPIVRRAEHESDAE
jgi:hypothetical protein